MTGVGDDSRGRLLGRPWFIVGFALAVVATLALVLSNDLRWLRLGIVAALWAALIGAFLAVKYRKNAVHSEDAVAEAQAVYELELEREIAARREFELEIEAETRERAEADSRDELDALRAEVVALRESLQSLFGGEVLYERFALTAQATRMRSINDVRLVTGPEGNGKPAPAQLVAGKKSAEAADRPTELIERVIDKPAPSKPLVDKLRAVQHTQSAPVPARPKQSDENGPPTRRDTQKDGVGGVAARVAKAAGDARVEANRRKPPPTEAVAQRPQSTAAKLAPVPPKPQSAAAVPPKPTPSKPAMPSVRMPKPVETTRPAPERPRVQPDLTRPGTDRVERGRPAASEPGPATQRVEPIKAASPAEPANELDTAAWKPSWTSALRDRSASDLSAAFASREDLTPVTRSADDALQLHRESRKSVDEQYVPTRNGTRPEASSKVPEPAREITQTRPGGRRRRAEDDDDVISTPKPAPREDPAPVASSGGRRRRPEGEPPRWQGSAEPESVNGSRHSSNGSAGNNSAGSDGSSTGSAAANGSGSNDRAGSSGSHAVPDTTERNGSHGRRAAAAHSTRYDEPSSDETGSHAAGRSVTELLAAHGARDATPRRRRRAED
jgi:hypothetical protein